MLRSTKLFQISRLTPLTFTDVAVLYTRLPGRGANILGTVGILKHVASLLQSLAGRLGEEQEDVDEHGSVEDTEDNVRLPLDSGECRWHEQAQCRVECPVTRGCQRDTLAAEMEREELRRVNPRSWTPGRCERGHEKVGTSDQTFRGSTRHFHRLFGNSINPARNDHTVVGQDTGIGVHESGHQSGADEQCGTATPTVNIEQSGDSHEDVDDVLDGRRKERGVAPVACHAEDIRNVIHF